MRARAHGVHLPEQPGLLTWGRLLPVIPQARPGPYQSSAAGDGRPQPPQDDLHQEGIGEVETSGTPIAGSRGDPGKAVSLRRPRPAASSGPPRKRPRRNLQNEVDPLYFVQQRMDKQAHQAAQSLCHTSPASKPDLVGSGHSTFAATALDERSDGLTASDHGSAGLIAAETRSDGLIATDLALTTPSARLSTSSMHSIGTLTVQGHTGGHPNGPVSVEAQADRLTHLDSCETRQPRRNMKDPNSARADAPSAGDSVRSSQ